MIYWVYLVIDVEPKIVYQIDARRSEAIVANREKGSFGLTSNDHRGLAGLTWSVARLGIELLLLYHYL